MSVHSYRVLLINATRSPGSTPAAINPLASAVTSSRNCAQVTSCQPSGVRRENWTVSGDLMALSQTGSVRLVASPISTTGGTENSCTTVSLDGCTGTAKLP